MSYPLCMITVNTYCNQQFIRHPTREREFAYFSQSCTRIRIQNGCMRRKKNLWNSILNSFVCLPGSKSPEILREQLASAMKQEDKYMLEKAINECVSAGFSELDSNIHQARDVLSILSGGQRGILFMSNSYFPCLFVCANLFIPVSLLCDTVLAPMISHPQILPSFFF